MRLRSLVGRNVGLKLLALVLALAVWLIYIPEERTFAEKTLSVSLELRGVPQDLEIVERPAATVDVTVRAPNRILNALGTSEVHAVLPLDRATVYQTGYPIDRGNVQVPQGVEVVEVNPNQVTIVLERAREVSLPVQPVVIGRPGEGFRVARVAADPDRVLVRGPESRFERRGQVKTSPVDVTGLQESAVFEVDLIVPGPELRVVSGPSRAKVSIDVEPVNPPPAPPAKKK